MRPGMRVKGTIEVERREDTLMVPFAALVPAGRGARVWAKTDSHQGWIEPQLGRRNGDWVEVLGGLEAGDRVRFARSEQRGLES